MALILAAIGEALAVGKRVEIREFGSFRRARIKERIARNPKTGESLRIAAKDVVRFKPGKALRERVNGT